MLHGTFKVDVTLFGVAPAEVLPNAFCALNPKTEVIRTLQTGIVSKYNGFAIRTLQMGGHDVTLFEFNFRIGMRLASFWMFDNIIVQTPGFTREGAQAHQAIAAVEVEHSGNGAQAMCWIKLTVAVQVMIGAPSGFAVAFFAEFYTRVVSAFTVIEQHSAEVVLVATLRMYDFAKHALAHHV